MAPTRSGKGVGLVNPTALTWLYSVVFTDLKGELYALSSGWRSKYANNYVIRFEPAKERKCVDKIKQLYNVARWNPLDEIRAEGSTEYCYDIKTDSIKKELVMVLEKYLIHRILSFRLLILKVKDWMDQTDSGKKCLRTTCR